MVYPRTEGSLVNPREEGGGRRGCRCLACCFPSTRFLYLLEEELGVRAQEGEKLYM